MTTAAPLTFDQPGAIRDAVATIRLQADTARSKIDDEVETAIAVAHAYAQHLAAGGDPLEYRTRLDSGRDDPRGHANVSPFSGLIVVYRAWNAGRGAPHEVLPFQNLRKWAVAEHLTAAGGPVSYAELCDVWKTSGGRQGRSSARPSSDAIARVVFEVEWTSKGRLVARRTEVDGKVAYLVRERRPDDPEQDAYGASSLPQEV